MARQARTPVRASASRCGVRATRSPHAPIRSARSASTVTSTTLRRRPAASGNWLALDGSLGSGPRQECVSGRMCKRRPQTCLFQGQSSKLPRPQRARGEAGDALPAHPPHEHNQRQPDQHRRGLRNDTARKPRKPLCTNHTAAAAGGTSHAATVAYARLTIVVGGGRAASPRLTPIKPPHTTPSAASSTAFARTPIPRTSGARPRDGRYTAMKATSPARALCRT
jgi:hypothetical protein